MEKTSYLTNYLKIYFWKAFSIILNLLSMFIVVPRITSEPIIYGVYMLCISTVIFLSYADIGFVSAGYKYSAECFARKDLTAETEIQGFVSFVLAVFVCFIAFFYVTIAVYPELIINDIQNTAVSTIASKIFIIQAIFSFSIILQRLNNSIFGVRLEDYLTQQVMIIFHIAKIVSTFYFFNANNYDIVGYFLFSKIAELLPYLICLFLARYRYGLSLRRLISSFRFSKKIFNQTKNLAIGSFYVTIMWIIYYELDSIAISYLLGAESLAYFSIGLTLSNFFRSLSSVIFSPFTARFNHFVGINDIQGLKKIFFTVIQQTMPVVVFPVLCILILMNPLIISWVGINYIVSVKIAKILIFTNLFIFITVPTSFIIISLEKIKQLYFINTIIAFVYWIGIMVTIHVWGLYSFAFFKCFSLIIASLLYLVIGIKFLEINLLEFIKKIILPVAVPIIFLIISLMIIEPFLPLTKGKMNLLFVVLTGGVLSLLSIFLYYFLSKDFKMFVNEKAVSIFKKNESIYSGV